MLVKLMTDAPRHNLALMKISTHHKQLGDDVFLGRPQDPCDFSYASWLFSYPYQADVVGGTGVDPSIRLDIDCKPDYSLFNLDYSVGFTWEYCPRKCEWCVAPKQNNPKTHNTIWKFHDHKFKSICLLNNNTFSDPKWQDTFEEILDEDLTVIDENGYDLRLLDENKIDYLNKTKFSTVIHFAWDDIKDERKIRSGLKTLRLLKHHPQIYVMVGFPNLRPIDETDLHRCQVIVDAGFDPFVMVYNRIKKSKSPIMHQLNQFQRMVNRTYIWRKLGFAKAWEVYK
jgi:hypothetical protein